MKLSKAAAALAAAATLFAPLAQAVVINSVYTPAGAGAWLVDLTLVFDGSPSSISNFTVDFPSFSNLVLVASPSTWDTLLVQPDPALPDAGFLDSLALTPAAALTGGSLGGFRVSFTTTGTPGALPFVISDASFSPIASGMTVATVVPEPAAWLLMALGLGSVAAAAARSRAARRTTLHTTLRTRRHQEIAA